MDTDLMFSSKDQTWYTPPEFVDALQKKYPFELDVCATEETAKCDLFFDPEIDGLRQSWGKRVCWMNPPYGRELSLWIDKAIEQAKQGATVVCLVPARIETKWFHRAWDACAEVYFVRGRIKFGGADHGAPFPSAVFVLTGTPAAPLAPKWLTPKGEPL